MLAAVVRPTVPHSWLDPERRRQNNRSNIAKTGRHTDVHERIAQRRPRIAQGVVGRGVQAAESRREQSNRRACKNPPYVERIFVT